jgi:hypothetical protein
VKRRLFIVMVGISLLPCVAVTVLWMRSYWIADFFGLSQLSALSTDRGELLVLNTSANWNFNFQTGYHKEEKWDPNDSWNPRRVARHTWNILLAHGEESSGLHITVVSFWAMFVATACPLSFLIGRYICRHRRLALHYCVICGYDLRATPARCPECGTVVTNTSVGSI